MPRPTRPRFLALSGCARLLRVLPALVVLWLAVAWAQGGVWQGALPW